MEIVVHLPTSPAISARGFEFDSAFPGPELLASASELVRAATQSSEARLLLFGHADEAGSEAYNKALSDQRAKVMLALLTQDLALFDQVAQENEWTLIHYQATLRALGVAPMDRDGKPGPATTAGTRLFQRAYNHGVHHLHALCEPSYGRLLEDGILGPATKAALRDAYLAQVRVKLDPARFFGPRTAGCSEFNRSGAGAAGDRRVVLALYRADFPTESKIPCKAGDVGSCKLYRKAKHPWKCNFYRRTLDSESPVSALPLAHHGEIEVELRSTTANPKGIAFSVHFEDGTTVEGQLDERGFATIVGPIDQPYEVAFHDLDADEWEAVH